MIYSIFGFGKGKTEASIGLAIRTVENGERVLFAQFMKDGYSEALNFANGDIELANQLFSDLASHSGLGGGAGEFASNEAQYDKFQLYLEHNDSPLANADSSAMKVRDGSGGGASLGDAVSEVLVQNQEAAQSEEGTKKPAPPIITTLLGGPA